MSTSASAGATAGAAADESLARPLAAASVDATTTTQERLLDAAERLFGERGFEGTSIRAVTQAAGVSVSAANYHFGSKEALLHATLRRVLAPINAARMARIDALEREAGDAPVPLEALLDAFLRPGIEARRAAGDLRFRNVAACLFAEPPDRVEALRRDLFGPLRDRVVAALSRTLGIPEEEQELELAFHFVVGMMVHVIGGQLEPAPGATAPDDGVVVDHMIAFAAAGLRAVCERA